MDDPKPPPLFDQPNKLPPLDGAAVVGADEPKSEPPDDWAGGFDKPNIPPPLGGAVVAAVDPNRPPSPLDGVAVEPNIDPLF